MEILSEDYYYFKARSKGYRSRASFKLEQIDKKFHVFHKGALVVDLGAAPGGWSQVAARRVGDAGKVIAIDKAYISSFKQSNIEIVQKDIFDAKLVQLINKEYGLVDVLLSDCAPSVSGNWSRDHFTQIMLADRALDVAENLLRNNGVLVCKLFQGSELQKFMNRLKSFFGKTKLFKPEASRIKSSEIYAIGLNFKKPSDIIEKEENSPNKL